MDNNKLKNEDFGKRLRTIRKAKNVSVKELAEGTGLSETMIYEFERGKVKNPRIDSLSLIADYMKVKLDTFYNIKDNNKYIVSQLELTDALFMILEEKPLIGGKKINQKTKDYIEFEFKHILEAIKKFNMNEGD
jgi:transcriptional regulator with XRE-family HTH domain